MYTRSQNYTNMMVGKNGTQTFEVVVVVLLLLMFLSPQVYISYYYWKQCLPPVKGEVVLHPTPLPLGVAKDVLRTNTLFTPAFFRDQSSSSLLLKCQLHIINGIISVNGLRFGLRGLCSHGAGNIQIDTMKRLYHFYMSRIYIRPLNKCHILWNLTEVLS